MKNLSFDEKRARFIGNYFDITRPKGIFKRSLVKFAPSEKKSNKRFRPEDVDIFEIKYYPEEEEELINFLDYKNETESIDFSYEIYPPGKVLIFFPKSWDSKFDRFIEELMEKGFEPGKRGPKYESFQKVFSKLGFKKFDLLKKFSILKYKFPYPGTNNPDKVKIYNSVTKIKLREKEIAGYYKLVKPKIFPIIKGKRVAILVAPTFKESILRRKIDDRFLRILTEDDYDEHIINSGSSIVLYREVSGINKLKEGNRTKVYYVDIDPGGKFQFKKTKELAKNCYELFKKQKEVKSCEILFSGGIGFHILGYLKEEMHIDKARENIEGILSELIERGVTLGIKEREDECRLDVTPVKERGLVKVPWSLSQFGLVACPVSPKKVLGFNKDKARIEKLFPKDVVKVIESR